MAAWDVAPFGEVLPGQSGNEFTLRLRRGHESIWVEVFDTDLRLPRIRSAGESDEGGRGLYLVDQLATRWGSRPTKDGKAVWFELPIKGGLGRPADRLQRVAASASGRPRPRGSTMAKPTMAVIQTLPLTARPNRRRPGHEERAQDRHEEQQDQAVVTGASEVRLPPSIEPRRRERASG